MSRLLPREEKPLKRVSILSIHPQKNNCLSLAYRWRFPFNKSDFNTLWRALAFSADFLNKTIHVDY